MDSQWQEFVVGGLFLTTPGLLVFLVWYIRNRLKDRKLAKVLNFRRVPTPTPGLYRSARPAAVGPLAYARILKRRKIRTVIDLRTDRERGDSDQHYRELPEVLVQPDAGPVLLHCAAGRDRTGIVVGLLRAALGHDADSIAQDYALTGIRGGTPAHEETMREFLRLVEARPGGLAGLLQTLGIDSPLY